MIALALAWGGQVMVETVGLDEVVKGSDAAIVVRLGSPGASRVSIPVGREAGKDCGTYEHVVWDVEVVEVVQPSRFGPSLSVGDALAVWPATTGLLIDLERYACRDGTRKSPAVRRYEGISPPDGGTALVLLRWEQPWGWVEAAGGSWLAAGDGSRVRAIQRPPSRRVAEDGPVELACRTDADCVAGPLTCSACGACPMKDPPVYHRTAVAWFQEQCAAERPPVAPDTPQPTCAACPPGGPPPPAPPVCAAMRCGARP